MNNSSVDFSFFFFFFSFFFWFIYCALFSCLIHAQINPWQGQTLGCTCRVTAARMSSWDQVFIPLSFFFFFFFFCYKWLKEKERDLHTNTCAQQSSTRKIHNTNVIHTHGCCGGAGRWDCFQGGTCSGMWECRGSAGAEKGGMENTIPQFIFSGLSTFLKPRGGMRASSKLPLILL